MDLTRAFTAHPASVGESYTQHLRMASGFALRLLGAACACLVHALLPFLFERTGSRCISELHERMVTSRTRYRRPVTPSAAVLPPAPTLSIRG